jgi:translation initiation factor 2 alpha subunit (eIF-2alpha)
MADELGLAAGAKGISDGYKTAKAAGKQIGGVIEDSQKEIVDVAKQRANERLRQRKEVEFKKQQAIYKALEEYKRKKFISEQEYQLKVEFIKKYGSKEWEEVLRIKTSIEKIEQADKVEFDAELVKVRKVMFACYFVAAWIAWYIVWGSK